MGQGRRQLAFPTFGYRLVLLSPPPPPPPTPPTLALGLALGLAFTSTLGPVRINALICALALIPPPSRLPLRPQAMARCEPVAELIEQDDLQVHN